MVISQVLSFFSGFGKTPGTKTMFRVGDTVHSVEDGRAMTVASIIRNRKIAEPLLLCKWDDHGETRSNFFLEKELDYDCQPVN